MDAAFADGCEEVGGTRLLAASDEYQEDRGNKA